jgi:hypothetical protein
MLRIVQARPTLPTRGRDFTLAPFKSPTLREMGFNFVICDSPAAQGEGKKGATIQCANSGRSALQEVAPANSCDGNGWFGPRKRLDVAKLHQLPTVGCRVVSARAAVAAVQAAHRRRI